MFSTTVGAREPDGRRPERGDPVVCMIETPVSANNVEEIAKVDGVDVIDIGANDLLTAMGKPGQFGDPEGAKAIDRVISVAANGKIPGMGGDRDLRARSSTSEGALHHDQQRDRVHHGRRNARDDELRRSWRRRRRTRRLIRTARHPQGARDWRGAQRFQEDDQVGLLARGEIRGAVVLLVVGVSTHDLGDRLHIAGVAVGRGQHQVTQRRYLELAVARSLHGDLPGARGAGARRVIVVRA